MTKHIIIREEDRKHLIEIIKNADLTFPWMVSAEFYIRQRTQAQNKLYWLWINEIIDFFIFSSGRYFTKTQINEWLLDLFAPMEVFEGGVFDIQSTSKMNKRQKYIYLNKIDIYFATTFDFLLKKPSDLYQEAMSE